MRREPACEFCGVPLDDMMLAFLDHVEKNETCKFLWDHWRGNVRREAGGT